MGCGGQVVGVIDGLGGNAKDWINIDAGMDPAIFEKPTAKELVDGFPRCMTCDMTKNLPFPDNFADEIYSHHSLEHVAMIDVDPTLREWHRVLKSGGKIEINVPDLLGIAKKIVETDGDLYWSARGERDGDWVNGYTKLLVGIFGDQSDLNLQLHRTGFTPRTMQIHLERAGFRDVITEQIWDMEIFCVVGRGMK